MTDYFVDDGGDNSDGLDWGGAYTSIQALQAAHALTSASDRVIIGADSNCTQNSGALTLTGPTSGAPIQIISSTAGSGADTTVAYAVGTGNQIYGDAGIVFDGSFALEGIRINSNASVVLTADVDEVCILKKCYILLGNNGAVFAPGTGGGRVIMDRCTIDGTAGGTTVAPFFNNSLSQTHITIRNCTFVAMTTRTGTIISSGYGAWDVSNCDFSGFTSATLCEPISGVQQESKISNCKLTSNALATPVSGTNYRPLMMTNVGTGDSPAFCIYYTAAGSMTTSLAIYRASGAAVEDVTQLSWVIATGATACEADPMVTPWIYGVISSAGTKTFTTYITNNTQDRTNAEVWLEVETMETSDSQIMTPRSDYRGGDGTTDGSSTGSATAQTDDTAGAWTGGGTYDQTLSVANVSVGEAGQFRWRVCVAAASLDTSDKWIYLDPKIVVT